LFKEKTVLKEGFVEKQAITAATIKKDIKAAQKEFGEYTFFDKGARETMDLEFYIQEFKKMSTAQSAKILLEVAKTRAGELFVSDILVECQEIPELDDWFERPDLCGNLADYL